MSGKRLKSKKKGKRPTWRIDVLEAPASAFPLLRRLKFRYRNDRWQLHCWKEAFCRSVAAQLKEAGCRGSAFEIEAKRKRVQERARQEMPKEPPAQLAPIKQLPEPNSPHLQPARPQPPRRGILESYRG